MIRKILILIVVSILLAGCITSEPAEKGSIQLSSSPSGAEIYLDSQYRGSTPSTIAGIEPGSHTLEYRMKGYQTWKSAITVPSGTSNYFASLTVMPGSGQEIPVVPDATAEPVSVTVRVSREQIVIGDTITFSGIASGTDSVGLTISGPGYYANGRTLDQVKPRPDNSWTYTWNPGTKIQSGTYTIIASDAKKTTDSRATFTAIGNGVVSVTPSKYAVASGDTVIFSGRCSTGAPNVHLSMFGPGKFTGGVDLGNFPVLADQTWSFRYTTDLTMPVGIYSVYVTDVPQTATGSSQFTFGYAS